MIYLALLAPAILLVLSLTLGEGLGKLLRILEHLETR